MDYNNFITDSIEQIENKLYEKISIDGLAEQSFFSKYHYQRLFHSIVGNSVMEYVKKRRLTLAGEELCRCDASVLDIALKYGYGSHESFTRAFKAFHGVTPTDCRKYAIFQSFSKLEITKERLIMTSNVMLLKNTEKTIDRLNDFVHQADKLGKSTMQIATTTNLAVFELVAKQTLLLSSQIKKEIARITDLSGDNSGSFTPVNSLFQVIKAIEDVAFRSNILALNANLQVARTASPQSEMVIAIGSEYLELAHIAATISSQTAILFGELSDLIQTDIKTQLGILMQNMVDTIKQIAKKSAAVTAFLKDESIKSGDCAKSIIIIADELGHISGTLCDIEKSLQCTKIDTKHDIVEWIDLANQALCSIEDLEFRVDILAYAGQFETARTPDQKGLNDAIVQLAMLAEQLYGTHRSCDDVISEIGGLVPLITENCVVSLEPFPEKMLTDILFQGRILNFYLKTEYAKFGYRTDIISNEQNTAFKEILQGIESSLNDIQATKPTYSEPDSMATLQTAFAILNKCTESLVNSGDSMGEFGKAVSYLAIEYKHFVKRIAEIKFFLKKG